MVALVWAITGAYLLVMLYVGYKSSKIAEKNYDSFTVGEKSLPYYLLVFTMIASVFGASNFVGHGDQAYHMGVRWLFFIAGESGAIIIFALTAAPFAARYNYKTLPELIDNVYVNDKYVRAIGGILLALVGIAWTGGQAMAIGYIYNLTTGLDATLVTVIASIVFITYTTMGGFIAVVMTDFYQGILIIITGAIFYFFSFNEVGFSLAHLKDLAIAADPQLWNWGIDKPWELVTMFLTGTFGMFALSFWWQRCFAAPNAKIARNVALIAGIASLIFVPATALVGIIARTLNPSLNGGATAWLAYEISPVLGTAMLVLLLAATLSTADSLLNSAATNIVNDVIRPFKPNSTDKELIKYTRVACLFSGIFSLVATFFFSRILELASFGYTIAGAAMVPLLICGWLASLKNSKLNAKNTIMALVLSGITSVSFEVNANLKSLLGGGILPGAIVCFVILLSGIFICSDKKTTEEYKI